jgi:type II secretory pathway component PulK
VIAARAGISLPIAQRVISYRASKSFNTTQDISNFLAQNGVVGAGQGTRSNANNSSNSSSNNNPSNTSSTNLQALGVSSNYFTIHAVVDDQQDQFRWIAFVYRPNRSGQWPQILWQHPE